MKTSDLVFVGICGSVLALHRVTGGQVWETHLKGTGFVNVVLQDGLLLASCYGEIFCLDPFTGRKRWHNRLKGFGTGLATITTNQSTARSNLPVLAEQMRREEQAGAAAAAASVAACA